MTYRNLRRGKTWRENLRASANCVKCGLPTILLDLHLSSSSAQKMLQTWSRLLMGRCSAAQKFEWSLRRQTALGTWSDRSGATRPRQHHLRLHLCLLTESRPCSPFRLAPSRWYLLQFRVVRYHRFYRCATPRYRHAEAATIYVSRMSRVFGGTVRRPLCPFFCLLRSSTEDDRLLAVTGKMRSFVVYCNAHSGFL